MRYLVCLFFAFHSVMIFSQGEKIDRIWYGPNDEVPNFKWQAQWIWMDDSLPSDVMLARRIVNLKVIPDEALLRITATSQYQLFINGEAICRGPARSAAHHQSFDILDITNLLQVGKNSIAVRVHYQRGTVSYHHEGRPGLLAQLDIRIGQKETSMASGNDWKVSPDTSWDNEAKRINRFQLVVNDKVDLQKEITGWQFPEFDDSNWEYATALVRNVGWPSPQVNAKPLTLTPPWTSLIPRDIPYLIEKDISTNNLIQAIEIDFHFLEGLEDLGPQIITKQVSKQLTKSVKEYKKGKGPLVIPASEEQKSWLLLFDFGTVLNGMPQLDIQGLGGTKVAVLSAPFVVDGKFSHKVVASKYIDELVLSGKRDSWEATYFKPTRYMAIAIQSGAAPIYIHNVGLHQIRYPFEKKGSMTSSEAPWIEEYFDASAKTIDVCTTDAFTDNYRERRQYAQTGYYAALGNYWTFGDTALQRRYLVQVAQEQKANGIMPAYAPLAGDDFMVILDSNYLYISGLHNYLLYSGDEKTVLQLLPEAKKLMELLHSYTDESGKINNPPFPYWLDHAVNDRRGANLNLNGHYLGALQDFTKILGWLGDKEQATYQKRAELLRKSIKTQLWDENKGLFSDAFIEGKKSTLFSEHGNAMALSLKIADSVQAKKMARLLLTADHNYIKNGSGITMATPAMSYFLYKGLCEYGYVDEAFRMFRDRFDKMLQPNSNNTLWEEWWLDGTGRSGKLKNISRSDAQTESAFAPALFAEYILGVRPTRPGMKELEVYRTQTNINILEANVPSPMGNLFIKWDVDTEGVRALRLNIPGEMKIKLDLKSLEITGQKPIFIDKKRVSQKELENQYVYLKQGKHIILF